MRIGPIAVGTLLGMTTAIGLLETGDVATACGVVMTVIVVLIWCVVALHPPVPASPAPAPALNRQDLRMLTDRQLGHEWRRSRVLLSSAGTGDELARVCALRRRQLDEIERRDPTGFQRWMADGGWADGSTVPFLGAS
jgi:hypothetical protein